MKNIYLVKRNDDWSYDDYDSFVCIAKSKKEARSFDPTQDGRSWGGWSDKDLTITKIGTTTRKKSMIILSSYNAG